MKVHRIIKDLKRELDDLSPTEIQEYRVNPEFIKYVCNIVETEIGKKKYKPNKKEIVLQILAKLTPEAIVEKDKNFINTTIEFLHSNGDIKEITLLRYLGRFFYSFVKKKFVK
jgi:hypothetical protein